MANEIMIGDIPVATANPKIAVVPGDRAAAQNIEAMGAIAGDVVQGVQQARTRGAIQDTAAGLSATEELIAQRETAGEQFDEEAAIEEIGAGLNKRAAKSFSKIRADLEQRGGGRGAAARRAVALVEQEVRNISALTPGFARGIRQTAASVLGFDPTGATMERLFGMKDPTPKEPKTDTETLKDLTGNFWTEDLGQRAFAYMRSTNASPYETMDWLQRTGQWQFENNMIAARQQLAQGDIGQRQYVDNYIQNTPLKVNFGSMTEQLLTVAKVEGLDKLDQARASMQLDEWVEQQVTIAKKEGVVNQAEIDRLRDHLTNSITPYKTLVSNTNSFEILKENADTFQQLSRRGLQMTAPEFMTLAEGLNPAFAKEVFDLMLNSSSGEVFMNRLQSYPALKQLFDQEGNLNAVGYVLGEQMSIMTGKPNKNLPADPQAQAAIRRAAAQQNVQAGALANENTSSKTTEADPKVVLTEVAKNPQLGLSIPDGKSWDIFQSNYISNWKRLTEDMAAEAAAEGGSISVGTVERRSGGNEGITTSTLPGLQFNKKSEGLLDWMMTSEPKQMEQINNVFARIAENPELSRRMFNGNQISREQFINLTAQSVQINGAINQIQALEERQLTISQDLANRSRTQEGASESYFQSRTEEIGRLEEEIKGLQQAVDFGNDQLRRYGMEIK